MAENNTEVNRWQAGEDYLTALKKLGLDPEALFWAHDKTIEQWVLVLVTHMFDTAGPLTLSKTLFKAYNAAATPQEIDPFIVRLHSPKQAIIQELARHHVATVGIYGRNHRMIPIHREMVSFDGQISTIGDLVVPAGAIYKLDPNILKMPKSLKALEASKHWRRFSSNVDAFQNAA